MKLKYYLRGLGIGIIVTTIILMITFSRQKNSISDEEIIRRAEALGMVMQENGTEDSGEDTEAESGKAAAQDADGQEETEQEDISASEPGDAGDAKNPTDLGQTESSGEAASEETEQENYTLTVSRGEVCREICEELQENGIVDDAEAFRKYLGSVGYASNISTGIYEVPYGLSYEELYEVLKAGPVAKE